MVQRATRRLQKMRGEMESLRDSFPPDSAIYRKLNRLVEDFRNLETFIQPGSLKAMLSGDVTLVRELLSALDPLTLRDAWLGLEEEQRAAILRAARNGEAEIKADEA